MQFFGDNHGPSSVPLPTANHFGGIWPCCPALFCRGFLADNENRLAKGAALRTAESGVARAADRGIRLTLIWSVATIIILSAISGKRPHYLLPMFPALALLVSYLIVMHAHGHFIRARVDVLQFAVVLLLLATALLFAPEIGAAADKSVWVDPTTRVWSGPLFLITLVLLWHPPKGDQSPPVYCRNQCCHGWIIHG